MMVNSIYFETSNLNGTVVKIYLKKSRLSDYTISSRICLLYKPEYFDLCILCFEIPALLFFPY